MSRARSVRRPPKRREAGTVTRKVHGPGLPPAKAGRCLCGCGQAHAGQVRWRLVACPFCGRKLRMTRSEMAGPRLYCGCPAAAAAAADGRAMLPMEPVCDIDAANAGFADRAQELADRMTDSQLQSGVRARKGSHSATAGAGAMRWYELRRDRKPRARQPNTPVRVKCLADWTAPADMPF